MPEVAWDQLFRFTVSPFELFIRGSILYLSIFVLMRVLRREPGAVGIADLLMVVLIADAAQNGMAGQYRSVADGLVLVLTIVFWNYAIDWLSFHAPWIERFTYPQPIALIENGMLIDSNMRKQLVTKAQLLSILRQHGVCEPSSVTAASIEGNGQVIVIQSENDSKPENRPPTRPVH